MNFRGLLSQGAQNMLPPGLLGDLDPQTQQYLTNRVKMGGLADIATAIGQGLDKYYGAPSASYGPQGAGAGGGYTQQALGDLPGLLEYQQAQQQQAQEKQRVEGLLGVVDQMQAGGLLDEAQAAYLRANPEALGPFWEERHKAYSLSPGEVRGQAGTRLDSGPERTLNVSPGAAAYAMGEDGKPRLLATRETAAMQNQRAGIGSDSDNVRMQKLRSLQAQGVPLDRAERLVDGFERIEVVPQLGVARYVNVVSGTVDEVPLGTLTDLERAFATQPRSTQPQAQHPSSGQVGLYEAAERGTGPYSAFYDLASRLAGFDPTGSVPIAERTVEARAALELSNRNLVRALSNNPRFPVAEMERIRQQTQIEPGVFDSPQRLTTRLMQVEDYIAGEMQAARRIANDPNTPMAQRQAYRHAADDMENYLARFGPRPGSPRQSVPQTPTAPSSDVPSAPPPGVPMELWMELTPEEREAFQ